MLHVVPVACLADNYAWVLCAPGGADCVVVDPGEAAPVAAFLARRQLTLRAIWLTHHHHDHIGGVRALMSGAPEGAVCVVGAAVDRHRLPPLGRAVVDADEWPVLPGAAARVQALAVPGHTLGAVAYWVPAAEALFTGDTLFTAGCGRLMEGSAAQMHASLRRLASLPEATRVYCGHEYTAKNLAFAASVLPDDAPIARRRAAVERARAAGEPSVPATLAQEQATNLFLRAQVPAVQAAVGAADAEGTFAALRARRDAF